MASPSYSRCYSQTSSRHHRLPQYTSLHLHSQRLYSSKFPITSAAVPTAPSPPPLSHPSPMLASCPACPAPPLQAPLSAVVSARLRDAVLHLSLEREPLVEGCLE